MAGPHSCGPAIGAAVALLLLSCSTAAEQGVQVVAATELGNITMQLYPERAPRTVANFLRYVDEGRYKGAAFYRSVRLENQPRNDVKIEVIQGGLGYGEHPQRLPPIAFESTRQTGLLHRNGVVSMARGPVPGSASSEIFICIGDQPELDFGGRRHRDGHGFAAFGRVTQGMHVVMAIHKQPLNGQILRNPVRIYSINRAAK